MKQSILTACIAIAVQIAAEGEQWHAHQGLGRAGSVGAFVYYSPWVMPGVRRQMREHGMRSAINWKAYLRPRFGLKFSFLFMAAFAVYLSAYRALMEPMILADIGGHGIVIEGSREPHYGSLARDGALNAFCRVVFAPIERIDYLMRPQYWDEYSDLTDPQDIRNIMGGWSEVTRNSE